MRNNTHADALDQAQRAQCISMAALLQASAGLGHWALLMVTTTVLMQVWHEQLQAWWLLAMLLLGLAERYLALRLRIDAGLFAALAAGTLPTLSLLDQALAATGLRQAPSSVRPLVLRVQGTRRLLGAYMAIVLLQSAITAAQGVVLWMS